MCGALEDPLRLLVSLFTAQTLEVDRTTNNGLCDGIGYLGLRLVTDVQHHGAHQVFEHRHLLWF